jgi:hypothetical protein
MSSGANGLGILAQERDNILQAEIGALLHNLGKLSHAFLAYQRLQACQERNLPANIEDRAYEGFNYQAIAGLVAGYIAALDTVLTDQDRERLKSSTDDWLDPTTSSMLPENIRCLFQDTVIQLPSPLNDRKYAIGDFIEFQAYKWYRPQPSGPRINIIFPGGSRATELLEIAHHAASGATTPAHTWARLTGATREPPPCRYKTTHAPAAQTRPRAGASEPVGHPGSRSRVPPPRVVRHCLGHHPAPPTTLRRVLELARAVGAGRCGSGSPHPEAPAAARPAYRPAGRPPAACGRPGQACRRAGGSRAACPRRPAGPRGWPGHRRLGPGGRLVRAGRAGARRPRGPGRLLDAPLCSPGGAGDPRHWRPGAPGAAGPRPPGRLACRPGAPAGTCLGLAARRVPPSCRAGRTTPRAAAPGGVAAAAGAAPAAQAQRPLATADPAHAGPPR